MRYAALLVTLLLLLLVDVVRGPAVLPRADESVVEREKEGAKGQAELVEVRAIEQFFDDYDYGMVMVTTVADRSTIGRCFRTKSRKTTSSLLPTTSTVTNLRLITLTMIVPTGHPYTSI